MLNTNFNQLPNIKPNSTTFSLAPKANKRGKKKQAANNKIEEPELAANSKDYYQKKNNKNSNQNQPTIKKMEQEIYKQSQPKKTQK